MKAKNTFKSLLVISSLLLQFNLQAITIHVETAGMLSTLIDERQKYEITELTLTGDLNGTDIRYIREMAGLDFDGIVTSGKLTTLDLAGTNIVSGGSAYSHPNLYTANNTIGKWMFSCDRLTRIILPNSITAIGESAFGDCTSLTSVTIPESVISIGERAFEHCPNLTSVTIGKSLSSIGWDAFYGCTGLKEFLVSEQNTEFSAIEGVLCNKDKTVLILYPHAKGTTYTIPNSIISIEEDAFAYCTSIESIIIPNVISIGTHAFSSCKGLTSVTIGDKLTSIGNLAFMGCSSLPSVSIPNSVTSIGAAAFMACTNLSSVTLGNGVTSIKQQAFDGCQNLTSIVIPNSLKSIEDRVFSGCTNLSSVIISESVTSIGIYSFAGCISLSSVIIPQSVTSIGRNAFYYCSGLTSFTIGKNVTSIGADAFEFCTGLTEVHCKNPIPFYIGVFLFSHIYHICKLFVPTGSNEAYKTADSWRYFSEIIEDDATAIIPISKDKISIHPLSNGIKIETKEATAVSVYTISGQKIYQSTIDRNIEINLNKGIYIVRANKESKKVIVN